MERKNQSVGRWKDSSKQWASKIECPVRLQDLNVKQVHQHALYYGGRV
jgi:hypothetical protein